MKFFFDILTESDNETYSLQRVGVGMGLLMVAAGFASQIWHSTLTPEIYQAFAIAWAGILMGGGVGAKLTPEAKGNG